MKVSAIVSAYFAEEFLAGRLENLLAQNPQPHVIIVCQRGSAEEDIAKKYPVDICLTDDIPTIYKAWNIGVKNAKGEYICNANSDDRHYPGALAKQIEVLDKNPKISAVYFDVDIVNSIGGMPLGRYEWMEGGIEQLLNGCFLSPMPMWRKSLHDKYGYFDEEMHSAGDYEYWLRLAKGGEKFQRIRQALGAYYSRKEGAEQRQKLRSLWEQARAKGRYREGIGIWKTPTPMTD